MRAKAPAELAAILGTTSLVAAYDWASTSLGPREQWPERLKAAVDVCLSSPLAMSVWWGPDLISIHNDASAANLGLKHPDWLGRPAAEVWSEAWPVIAPRVEAVLSTGTAQTVEDLLFLIDRSLGPEERYFTAIASPLLGDAGEIAGILVTAVDTTEKVLAKSGRTAGPDQIFGLLETAPGFFAILRGPDHVFAFANRAYREMAGDEQLIGKTHRLARPGQAAFSALLDQVYRSGERLVARQELVCGSDGTRYIDFVYEPIRDASGAVTGVFASGHDVTDHVAAEAALQASESRFRAVADLVPDMLWSNDADGSLIWFNKRWHEYTGMAHAALAGDGWLSTLHPEDRASGVAVFEQRSGTPAEHQHRVRRHDGEHRWHLARMEPVHDEDGRTTSWFGAITDIDELIRLQRHEHLLLAELQHRVRNTLAVVRSIIRRTGEQEISVEDYKQHLEGRIGAFARTQAQVTRDPTRGVSLLAAAADEFLVHGVHEGGQVTIDGPEIWLRPAAAEKLGLALHELATNAIKFGALVRDGGHVRVGWSTVERATGEVLLLDWREAVPGGIVEPAATGFGTELLTRSLPYELGARTTLEFGEAGLRFSLEVALARIAMPQPGDS